jgi:hypothetical protein
LGEEQSLFGICQCSGRAFPRLLKDASNCSQVSPELTEFFHAVIFVAPNYSRIVSLLVSLLLQPRLAAVGHGLVERLEVFESGLGQVLRGRAEVFVEPPVRGAPSLGVLPA